MSNLQKSIKPFDDYKLNDKNTNLITKLLEDLAESEEDVKERRVLPIETTFENLRNILN